MQQFLTILAFYKPFVIWSFLVNIAIAVLNPFIIPAIITKMFLAVFVWFLVKETNVKHKLNFYSKLGISPVKLFSILFIVDITMTIGFLEVIKEYI